MRFAKCYCKTCKKEFIITFSEDVPPFSLACIICDSKDIKYRWIDGE